MLQLVEDIELTLVEDFKSEVRKRMKSPVPWVGGKYYQALKIIEQVMKPAATHYAEVFGGGASVLLNKPTHPTEMYNDLNGDLVNLWLHARDNTDDLVAALESLPQSEELYMRWRDANSPARTDIYNSLERAVRFYYTLRNGFSGNVQSLTGWGYSTSKKNRATQYYGSIPLFYEVKKRFVNVSIHKRDWREIIKIHDTPWTIFYFDPPYVDVGVRCYSGCDKWAGIEEHYELAKILCDLEGYAAVSYYACPLVDILYTGWRRIAYNHYKVSGNSRVKGDGVREVKEEILLCNFDDNGDRIEVPYVL